MVVVATAVAAMEASLAVVTLAVASRAVGSLEEEPQALAPMAACPAAVQWAVAMRVVEGMAVVVTAAVPRAGWWVVVSQEAEERAEALWVAVVTAAAARATDWAAASPVAEERVAVRLAAAVTAAAATAAGWAAASPVAEERVAVRLVVAAMVVAAVEGKEMLVTAEEMMVVPVVVTAQRGETVAEREAKDSTLRIQHSWQTCTSDPTIVWPMGTTLHRAAAMGQEADQAAMLAVEASCSIASNRRN